MSMRSIWEMEVEIEPRGMLEDEIHADVCVIGAGLAGLNCALLLSRAGARVAVLEAERIASGQTGLTTGKISALQEPIYSRLGERAPRYAAAQLDALAEYARLAETYEFGFTVRDNYLFALNDDKPLRAELDAMRAIGLDAFWTDETELPFEVAGAIGLKDQASFHPLLYARAVSEALDIYEHSQALAVKDGRVATRLGGVTANHIIVATHYPMINVPGYYFLRMRQSRSYVAAVEGVHPPKGMYLDAAEGGLSFRAHDRYLLLSASDVYTGENPGGQFALLDREISRLYPGARVAARWSAQDCISADDLPYIGRYARDWDGVYVASGFRKWGMTNAMTAAIALTDLILGRKNDWAQVFDPGRSPVPALKGMLADAGASVKGMAGHLAPPDGALDSLNRGEARVVEWDGHAVGAYRDSDGQTHIVGLTCTHLGCRLNWNGDDLTWDCPCHGSRFDVDGQLLNGPAQRDARA